MSKQFVSNRREELRTRLRKLILLRETGPKSAAWHAARARLIWRLHDEIKRQERLERGDCGTVEGAEPSEDRS
jgi:hypothetical protein